MAYISPIVRRRQLSERCVLCTVGWQLTDAQIAAVTTYVRNSWGHAAPAASAGEAHDARKRADMPD
jgi:hypothetical protein